ncbi:hypothetical protein C0585_04080 [Candidatus Woesearchaeota archaeon]|nr:MAG: hypothetical protein C0585_04080 [Candidatus Woesearchaeota archaeon]
MFERDKFKSNLGKDIFERYFSIFEDQVEEKFEDVKEEISYQTETFNVEEDKKEVQTQKTPKPAVSNLESKMDNEKKSSNPFGIGQKESFVTPIRMAKEDFKKVALKKENLPLSCYDITSYLRNNRIIGEESLASLITVGLANGENINVQGDAGTGKTFLTDTLIKLFPKEDIYEISQISDQAIWKLADELNSYKIIYLPEFQKSSANKPKNNSIVEFVKTIAEGKNASKIVTIGKGVKKIEIPKGITFLTGIATENSFNLDPETLRRFTSLQTDSSKKHIENILDDKLRNCMNLDFNDNHKNLEERLSRRIYETMNLKDTYVINPFAESLKEYIPIVNKTQSYIDKYLNMMKGFAKFFASERTSFQIDDKKIILMNFEDVYNVFDMYDNHFKNILKVFNKDEEILDIYPDWKKIIDEGLYSLKNEISIGIKGETIKVGDHNPQLVDRWFNNQTIDGEISFIDYKTGDYISPIQENYASNPDIFYPLMKI